MRQRRNDSAAAVQRVEKEVVRGWARLRCRCECALKRRDGDAVAGSVAGVVGGVWYGEKERWLGGREAWRAHLLRCDSACVGQRGEVGR